MRLPIKRHPPREIVKKIESAREKIKGGVGKGREYLIGAREGVVKVQRLQYGFKKKGMSGTAKDLKERVIVIPRTPEVERTITQDRANIYGVRSRRFPRS